VRLNNISSHRHDLISSSEVGVHALQFNRIKNNGILQILGVEK